MRVNAKALMRVGQIRCLHEGADGALSPAFVALITDETVREARALGDRDTSLRGTDTSPEVRYGGALGYVRSPDGSFRAHILAPGEGGGFRMRDGTRLLGPDMLGAEHALTAGDLDQDGQRALSAIRSVFRMVCAVPDETRFPVSLIGQAYLFAMRSSFGDAVLPVSEEMFVRKARADLLRARISDLDPDHPDGIGAVSDFMRVLDAAGADARADVVRVAGAPPLSRRDARSLLDDDRFRTPLFGAISLTSPDRIEATVLPASEADGVDRALRGSRLSGAWADGVSRLGERLTGSGLYGYQMDLSLYVSGGRDLLLLSDTVGRASGIALVYSWPSSERAPVLQTPEGPVYAICPQEVPDPETVLRLGSALSDLEAVRGALVQGREALEA